MTETAQAQRTPIRVVIADDHAIVRAGLRALVEAQPGLAVVGEAADGNEAWQRARELHLDVLLLDLSMPGADGADAAERVARDCPSVRVLVLTMHEERSYLARLFRLGAAGYLLKRTAPQELVRAIRTIAGGERYVDPSLAGGAPFGGRAGTPAEARERGETPGAAAAGLAARELEILRRIAQGLSNGEIADALGIAPAEVETLKADGMRKLGLPNRAALVRFATEHGWGADPRAGQPVKLEGHD